MKTKILGLILVTFTMILVCSLITFEIGRQDILYKHRTTRCYYSKFYKRFTESIYETELSKYQKHLCVYSINTLDLMYAK